MDAAVRFELPTFPHDPPTDPGSVDAQKLLDVPDAYLTSVRQGHLRTVLPPTRWLRGAVHDAEGRLLPESQKVGGLGGNPAAQADPPRTRPQPGARRLAGTWLYGGHWIGHFGHFLSDTLPTLWPAPGSTPGEPVGLVFHRYFGAYAGVQDWQRELLALTGWGHLPVEVVDAEPVAVERLLLPTRGVVSNGWGHAGARDVWRRMRAAVVGDDGAAGPAPGASGDKVFLSRRVFNADRRARGLVTRTSEQRDVRLDRVFAEAGFRVVTPEDLPVLDQVRLAAGASVIAGCAGTALHLAVFAAAGTRVIELGDSRSPDVQVPQQRTIDRLLEHPSAFVPFSVPAPQVRGVLRELGVWG